MAGNIYWLLDFIETNGVLPMNEELNQTIKAIADAAAEEVKVSQTGNLLRSVASFADRNEAAVIGMGVVAAVGVGYLTYRAFTNRDEK